MKRPPLALLRGLPGLAVALFGVLVATGALLSLDYRPDPEEAWASVGRIASAVTLGWLVRGLHVVAAHALAAVVGLHVLHMFFGRTFLRRGGTAAWMLSVSLSFVVLAFLLTGETLPWDSRAYGRAVMIAARVETIPVLGHWFADVFRGGPTVGAGTLVRLAALHGLLLPWLAFAGIVLGRRLEREGRTA